MTPFVNSNNYIRAVASINLDNNLKINVCYNIWTTVYETFVVFLEILNQNITPFQYGKHV